MQFHVGPVVYRLVVSDRSIFDDEGNEIEGAAVENRRIIIISKIVEPDRREEIALHEFMHCWGFHTPLPRDEEERAQITALIAMQFRDDLEAQGGREALRSIPPTRVPHLGKPAIAKDSGEPNAFIGRPHRMTCSGCDTEILCGSIENGSPALDECTNRLQLERWMCCDICGTLTVWHEAAHRNGAPTGEVLSHPKPTMMRGTDAARWLADKRELAGA